MKNENCIMTTTTNGNGFYDITLTNITEIEIKKIRNLLQNNYGEKLVDGRITPVMCVTTGEMFTSIRDACLKYELDAGNIAKCCKGKLKSCGKSAKYGKLVWKYVDDLENKLQIK